MVSIAYLTMSRIPGTAANAVQVMKMAQALLKLDPNLLMTAISGNPKSSPPVNLEALYGVNRVPGNLCVWPVSGRLGIHFYNFRAAWAARRAGAQLVLTRSVGAAAFSAMLGLPTVWECHAPPSGFELQLWRLLARSSGFRRIVVISAALGELMLERFPFLKKMDLRVAHDGVDLERFVDLPSAAAAKAKEGLDPTRPVAGYAGHLYRGRGVEVILTCAESLSYWDFRIAGGTPEALLDVRRQVVHRGLKNVQLLGFVENSLLAKTMAVCDVLLMPYQPCVSVSSGKLDTATWMSPLKMFEYMAMGRAIITSDLPVLRGTSARLGRRLTRSRNGSESRETGKFRAPDRNSL